MLAWATGCGAAGRAAATLADTATTAAASTPATLALRARMLPPLRPPVRPLIAQRGHLHVEHGRDERRVADARRVVELDDDAGAHLEVARGRLHLVGQALERLPGDAEPLAEVAHRG